MSISIDHWAWSTLVFVFGACIGSFLNVVIHRIPRGLSINHPKRSFCPHCETAVPITLNLPIISWLWLRGKCAHCKASIAIRYLAVEFLTALLFLGVWLRFPPLLSPFLFALMALLVAITFIDAEHLVIPVSLTWAGAAIGLGAAAAWPSLPMLADASNPHWLDGMKSSIIGWASGFMGLWLVVELGKMAFGKKKISFEPDTRWAVREGDSNAEPMSFQIDGDTIPWWDIFNRKSDRLIVDCNRILVDGRETQSGRLVICESSLTLPDGQTLPFESLTSLEGSATSVTIPREAMGMGDIHLLGMIGAFFGWTGVIFALFAGSIFAIIAAIIGRVGLGHQLPFGPFLAMGCCAWALGGWNLWTWYLDFLAPLNLVR